jgi:hypothetical protein
MIRVILVGFLSVILAACGGDGADAAPAFDIELVQANYTDECEDPIVVDELFCVQVDVVGMTAAGTTLTVPTGLNPTQSAGLAARAAAICEDIARAHFDGATGEDLGYRDIVILDRDSETAAECSVN